jgi:hypothetical protein
MVIPPGMPACAKREHAIDHRVNSGDKVNDKFTAETQREEENKHLKTTDEKPRRTKMKKLFVQFFSVPLL